jgi:heat shock protein HtpX
MAVSTSRLRFSLFCRTLVALGILGTFTLGVAVVATVFGVIFGVLLFGVFGYLSELLVAAPRLSAVLPLSPAVLAVGGFVATLVGGWVGHSSLGDRLSQRSPLVPVVLLPVWFGCLYLTLVEAAAAFDPTLSGLLIGLCLGVFLTIWSTVATARRELGRLREQLLAGSEPAAETHPALVDTTSRLALQADVPSPTIRITDSDRPESFTLGYGTDAVIVVSTGLLATLSEAEVTAVLAHEISHLANADSRIMGVVLVPVLGAEELMDDNPQKPGEYVTTIVLGLLKLYGQFGVAILSRGREWHADAGAVALTGSPAALASALSTLSEQRERPTTDLRKWERSAGALDILPPVDRTHATGPFRTHPSTEKRSERLRQQVADAEGG